MSNHPRQPEASLTLWPRDWPQGVIVIRPGDNPPVSEQIAHIWRVPLGTSLKSLYGLRADGSKLAPDEFPLIRALNGVATEPTEIIMLRGDKTHGVALISAAPILNDDGTVVAAIASISDVTGLSRTRDALNILSEAAFLVSLEDLDFQSVIQRLVRLIGEAIGENAMLRLLSNDGQSLLPGVVYHPDQETEAEMAQFVSGSIVVSSGPLEEVIRQRRTIQYRYDEQVPPFAVSPPGLASFQDRIPITFLGAPMVVMDQVIGILSIFRFSPGSPFDREDEVFLRGLASQVGLALHNARLYREARSAEDRYHALFAGSADAILVFDQAGRCLEANAAAHELYGYEPDEMVGLSVEQLSPENGVRADWTAFLDQLNQSTQRGESSGRRKDGESIAVQWSAREDKTDVGPFIIITARDDSQRRAAQESQSRLAAIVGSSNDAIIGHDLAGVVLSWNPAAEQLFGYTAEEMIGSTLYRLVLEDRQADVADVLRAVAGGARINAYEAVRVHRDGRLLDVLITISPVRDPNGDIIGVSTIARDVSERTRAEQALRASEQRFRGTFEQAAVGMAIVALDGRYIQVNDRLCEMLGIERNSLETMSFLENTHPDDRNTDLDQMQLLLAGAVATYSLEKRYIRPDGRIIWVLLTVSLRNDDNERPEFFVVVAQDIDQRKANEDSLRQSEERLRQVSKMEAIGRLAGGIAHDFNNLLTVVLGNASLAIEDLEPGQVREHIEQIQSAARSAADLTRQLLAFSRLQLLQPTVLDPATVVNDIERLLRRTLGADVTLVLDLHPSGFVRVDRGQLEQVLMNLAINAREAMEPGGTLTLRLGIVHLENDASLPAADYVQLSVEDTGIGMDDATRQHIFEPFFTTKPQGTGLGLATVYGIVTQSGGSVIVESEIGVGSSFRILLPTVDEEPAEVVDMPHLSAGAGERVLLVEDFAALRHFARATLEEAGYVVVEAADATQALESAEPVDLLITDIVMPGMNGWILADSLRQRSPHLRVVFISGYTGQTDTILPPGAVFLPKPFSPEALTDAVRAALDSPWDGADD